MQYVLFALLPLVILYRPKIFPINRFTVATIIVLLATGLFSSIFSDDILKSLTGAWQISSLIISTLIVSISCTERSIKIISHGILAAISVYSLYFFIQVILDLISHNQEKIYMSYVHGFDNPRYLNQIQTCTIPIAILSTQLLKTAKTNFKFLDSYLLFLASTACCLYISIVFVMGGRGTVISLFLGFIIIWLIYRKKASIICTATVKFCAIGYLIYLIILFASSQLFGNIDSPPYAALLRLTSSGRLEFWSIAVESIKNSPWLGVGPLMYSSLSQSLNHPHNSILWLMSEWGVPGALVATTLMAYLYFKYVTSVRYANQKLDASNPSLLISYALVYAITASCIHSLVSGVYIVPASQMACTLLLIFATSNYYSLQKQLGLVQNQSWVFPSSSKMLIATFLLLLLIPASAYHERSEWGALTSDKRISPGYWLDGDL
jgi:hypothetical protein